MVQPIISSCTACSWLFSKAKALAKPKWATTATTPSSKGKEAGLARMDAILLKWKRALLTSLRPKQAKPAPNKAQVSSLLSSGLARALEKSAKASGYLY